MSGGPLPSDLAIIRATGREESNSSSRRFKKGDRVRVQNSSYDLDFPTWHYLQYDNRLGTIVGSIDSFIGTFYLLEMDKRVMKVSEVNLSRIKLSKEYAYFASPEELELIESIWPQGSFDIEKWRKNLKPGNRVRLTQGEWEEGRVVTLEGKNGLYWNIKEDHYSRDPIWFGPLDKSDLRGLRKQSESRKIKKIQREKTIDPRSKNLIQIALNLTQTIEATFRKTQKYPIFGINLDTQKSEIKNQTSRLDETLSSLGVVLYHTFTGKSDYNDLSFLLDGYPKPKDMPEEFWKVVDRLIKGEYRTLEGLREDLKRWGLPKEVGGVKKER